MMEMDLWYALMIEEMAALDEERPRGDHARDDGGERVQSGEQLRGRGHAAPAPRKDAIVPEAHGTCLPERDAGGGGW